jgi:AcrR family transcriptional regulator
MPPRARKEIASRKRRTGEEARSAILDAAERALVAHGPAGIRIQEVAADVGVSHPTVLHHFGSREALVEAVVARALDSLQAGLLSAVRRAPETSEEVAALLERVFQTLVAGGNARALFWLALAGHEHTIDQLHVRAIAEAVHEIRRERRRQKGKQGKRQKEMPPLEDTYFTVLLSALALLSMSVLGASGEGAEKEEFGAGRFRAWLARLMHRHLEEG